MKSLWPGLYLGWESAISSPGAVAKPDGEQSERAGITLLTEVITKVEEYFQQAEDWHESSCPEEEFIAMWPVRRRETA